jgi:hypothetical protein
MTVKDDNHRQIETDDSLREVSRNDAIASKKEKSSKGRKSRLCTFTEIMDLKFYVNINGLNFEHLAIYL